MSYDIIKYWCTFFYAKYVGPTKAEGHLVAILKVKIACLNYDIICGVGATL